MAERIPHPVSDESKHDYANEWDVFLVYCKDFQVAARYAAQQNWWLHCWHWVTDDGAPNEPRVYRNENPPVYLGHPDYKAPLA